MEHFGNPVVAYKYFATDIFQPTMDIDVDCFISCLFSLK